MSETLHRSENLIISIPDGGTRLLVEIRFPTTSARGWVDAACPRCGNRGKPEQWEIEGPDARTNTMWLTCTPDNGCTRETRWSRQVSFAEGWSDEQ